MNTMNTGVYAIRNTVNGKCYIGSAVNIKKRFGDHKRDLLEKRHHSIKLQRAHDKYGIDSFEFNKLIVCEKKNLLMYEQIAIDTYDSVNLGYNICPTAGSNLGIKFSDEVRKKMSESRVGIKLSDNHKMNVSIALKGVSKSEYHKIKLSNAAKGRKMSDEARAKISNAKKGVKQSAESIAKRSLTMTGIKRPEEYVKRMSSFLTGIKHATFSDESRRRMSIAQKGRKATEATKIKMSESLTGRTYTDDTLKKMSIGQKKRFADNPMSDETKNKLSILNKGKKLSEEARANMKEVWIKRKAKKLLESK